LLRVGALKRLLGAQTLAAIDGVLQRPLARLALSPSQFMKCSRMANPGQMPAVTGGLFKCPECSSTEWQTAPEELICANLHRWSTREGIYDFKSLLAI